MPSKIQLDENLWFLYICLQKSDLKTIDFNAVGHATSLKPPAARMRYTRLRRQIESGTLIGTQGTPFASSSASEKIAERTSKRKRSGGKEKRERGSEDKGKDGEGDGGKPDVEEGDASTKKTREVEKELEKKIKKEDSSGGYRSDGDTTEEDSDETKSWSSEDEVPLAKLRKAKSSITPRSGNDDSTRDRAEREGAPVRELEQEPQVQLPSTTYRLQPRLVDPGEDANGMRHYSHTASVDVQGERNVFAPGPPTQMYAPIPQHSMQIPLPPFGEPFGPSFAGPYHMGWQQFEDSRAGWSNSMEPLRGFSGWKPRKSV